MLHWYVVMRRLLFFLPLLTFFTFGALGSAQVQFSKPPELEITSPVPGEAVQGLTPIYGSISAGGVRTWELSFRYRGEEIQTWFLIAEKTGVIKDNVLAEWDTSLITDGVYDLRLLAHLENGQSASVIIEGIRIRNYTPIESDTPPPTFTSVPTKTIMPPTFTPSPTATETPVPPTLTPLPTNPVEISRQNFHNSLFYGAILAAVSFLLIGLYLSIRKTFR